MLGVDHVDVVGIGISYLKLFFNHTRNTKHLLQSLAAYDRADGSSNNPDLYQNRAIIHQYREHYEASIKDYRKASELDVELKPFCDACIQNIQKFVHHAYQMLLEGVNLIHVEKKRFSFYSSFIQFTISH